MTNILVIKINFDLVIFKLKLFHYTEDNTINWVKAWDKFLKNCDPEIRNMPDFNYLCNLQQITYPNSIWASVSLFNK